MTALPDPAPMRWQPRRFKSATIVLAVGLVWLAAGWSAPWWVALIATLPGVVLVGTGAGQLLWAGDRQLLYHMALAGPVSALLALLFGYWLGFVAMAILFAGGIATYFVAGWALRVQHPVPAGIEPPTSRAGLLAKVASDGALLGFFVNCARVPRGAAVATDLADLAAWDDLADRSGWYDNPGWMHGDTRALTAPQIVPARAGRLAYEWLSAESVYTPGADWPGRERWLAHTANRRFAARVFRHAEADRPWLVCIHGYRMGHAALDFPLFDIQRLHHELGLNLLLPVLPLHGARRATPMTGGLFLDGPLGDLMHGQAQALADLRSALAWIRSTAPGATIGTLGFSLGGYHAALLSCFEPDLAGVIAGIPMTDIPATLWQHMPTAHADYLEASGLSPAEIGWRLRPVSPLANACAVAPERRFIIAATADQLISPEQPAALARHWGDCPLRWYDGSHLSVRHEAAIEPFIEDALAVCGLVVEGSPAGQNG